MSDETLEAMCDNEIMQKLGWMSGVLADSGYGEQAGDVMRAMVFIHEQAQQIEKLRAALAFYADKDTWRSSTSYMCGHIGETRASMDKGEKARAAAAAYKETGDE